MVAALLLASAIFATVYGAAATLGAGTGFLSAGNATVASCESGAVTGTPNLTAAANGAYVVDGVTVSGLDPQCGGKTIAVTLTGSGGTSSLLSLSGVVPQGGGDVSLSGGTRVDASAVAGVSVAIDG